MKRFCQKLSCIAFIITLTTQCSGSTLTPQKKALTNSAIRAETAYAEGYPNLAASQWQEVIRKSQVLDDHKNEALGHANLATVYINSGEMELAEKHLAAVLELIDSRKEPELFLSNGLHHVSVLVHQEKLQAAQGVLEGLQTIVDQISNTSLQAAFKNAEGLLEMRQSSFKNALSAFKEALQLGLSNDDQAAQAAALNNLGFYYLATEDYHDAVTHFNLGLQIDKAREYLPGIGLNLIGLAITAEKDSNAKNAITLFERALRVNQAAGASHLVESCKSALKRLGRKDSTVQTN